MTPIAVVGLGALFPSSLTPEQLWQNIVAGRDLISDVPATHWLIEDYYDPQPGTPDKVYAARGGFLPPVAFAPLEYGMPPNVLPATDTAQLLALVVAKRVLEDALHERLDQVSRERISVILGVASATELVGHMAGRLQKPVFARAMRAAGLDEGRVARVLESVESCYVPWQESTFPGVLGNVVAGRIANRFDLGGTNVVLDAACASSLAAVELGVLELQSGRADMVVSGGVDALNDIFMHMCFGQTGALSRTGDCRPFSAAADGTLLGEGVGMLALRRLEDAERDGDAIYAVLRGIGSSSDGRAKSIYAPRPEGQAKAMRRAYELAGYGAETVELVEAHGTGTVAGDAAEFESTSGVFGEAGAPPRSVAFGSIKAQIGHTKAAAGAAGLIKVILALHHKVMPPTIKVDAPSPSLSLDGSPLYLNTQARPWISGADRPRRGGVSAFGFGGTNFHVTLEEYAGTSPQPQRVRPPSSELVLLHGDSFEALETRCLRLATGVETGVERRSLRTIARDSHATWAPSAGHRLAIIVNELRELGGPLRELLARLAKADGKPVNTPRGASYRSGPVEPGKLALLFPGQGSQHLDMTGATAMAFGRVREIWDQAERLGLDLRRRVFPPPSFAEGESERLELELAATEVTQPAIAVASLAMLPLLDALGVRADCVGGHSLGEVTALAAAGALDFGDAMRIAKLRGELMATANSRPGSMLAVRGSITKVGKFLTEREDDGVVIANHNDPRQVVLSGPSEAIAKIEEELEEAGFVTRPLRVSAAFHSPLVEDAVGPFHAALAEFSWSPTRCPAYSNVTAAPYDLAGNGAEGREQLASAIARQVRFVEMIDAMYEAGVRTFVEVGPDAVLSRLVKRCLKKRPHTSVALDERTRGGLDAVWRSIGQLATLGVPLQLDTLWDDERPEPAPAEARGLTVDLIGANYGKPDLGALPSLAPRSELEPGPTRDAPPPSMSMSTSMSPENSLPEVAPTRPPTTHAYETPTDMSANLPPKPPLEPSDGAAPPITASGASGSLIAAHLEFQRMMLANHEAFLRMMTSGGTRLPAEAPRPAPVAAASPVASAPAPDPRLPPVVMAPPEPAPAPMAPPPARAPQPSTIAAPLTAQPAPMSAPASPPVAGPSEDLIAHMLAVVSDKTGYPIDMLELGMEIEADLGIDSIKRVEILSTMRQRVPGLPEADPAKLAAMRTLAEIAGALGASQAAAEAPPPEPTGPPGHDDLVAEMLTVVSEKTGYPIDMLELGMEIEADLGIDSIKRVEILSTMRQRVPSLPEADPAKLAAMRTLAEIVEALSAGFELGAAELSLVTAPASDALQGESGETSLARFVVRVRPAAAAGLGSPLLAARRVWVLADRGGVATELASRLREAGVEVEVHDGPIDAAAEAEAVVDLRALDARSVDEAIAANARAFELARALAPSFGESDAPVRTLVLVQDTGGDLGLGGRAPDRAWQAGLAGLAKTAACEWPRAGVRVIDLELDGRDAGSAADALFTELRTGGLEREVGLAADGARVTLEATLEPVPPAAVALEPGSVLVVSGGARGVTARALLELAARCRPRLLILGRTPIDDEGPGLAAHTTDAALKRALLERARTRGESVSPRELGAAVARILAAREVRDNFRQLERAGATVEYAAVDVRSEEEVRVVIDEARARWGRIDGVIHGAGVLADAYLRDKSHEQFRRVFETKVLGLRALLRATEADPLRWLCLFSSVAARSGNPGQADYAMANEILNKVAAAEARRRGPSCAVSSIGWGPWAGGMVTPALASMFEARGVDLIPLAAGSRAFVRELEAGGGPEVVIGAGLDLGRAGNFHARVRVREATDPQLHDHRVRGQVVLPVAQVLEWFAWLARAEQPTRESFVLDDVRVLRGVVLDDFEGQGIELSVGSAGREDGDVELAVVDPDGVRRHAAILRAGPASLAAIEARELPASPWSPAEVYGPGRLFHGPAFRAIVELRGLSEAGASARLHGLASLGASAWTERARALDPVALDGMLQLALLCGLQRFGEPSLPLSIARCELARDPGVGPYTCELRVRGGSAQHSECDASLIAADGRTVARLDGLSMYALPRAAAAK